MALTVCLQGEKREGDDLLHRGSETGVGSSQTLEGRGRLAGLRSTDPSLVEPEPSGTLV